MKKIFLILPMLISCSTLDSTNTTISTSETSSNINTSINLTSNTTSSNITPFKIYLNPSVQYQNIYYDKINNEGDIMLKISKELFQYLSDDMRFEVKANHNKQSLKQSMQESNLFNPDLHLSLHSNAGGGHGVEAYYSASSYDFSYYLSSSLASKLSRKNRGPKNGNHLYEINSSRAKQSVLLEILFHDHYHEHQIILNNINNIAQYIYQAIVQFHL